MEYAAAADDIVGAESLPRGAISIIVRTKSDAAYGPGAPGPSAASWSIARSRSIQGLGLAATRWTRETTAAATGQGEAAATAATRQREAPSAATRRGEATAATSAGYRDT